MVQPKKPPVSLRVPDALKVAVEQWAAARGVPRNAAYVELIQRGLKAAGGVPKGPECAVSAKALAATRKANDDSKIAGALQAAAAGKVTTSSRYVPRADTFPAWMKKGRS